MSKQPAKKDGTTSEGDAILKRMLQGKPKTHDAMVKERREGQGKAGRTAKSKAKGK